MIVTVYRHFRHCDRRFLPVAIVAKLPNINVFCCIDPLIVMAFRCYQITIALTHPYVLLFDTIDVMSDVILVLLHYDA